MRRRPTVLIAAPLALLPLLWGFVVEPSTLELVHYDLAIPNWPAACHGLRVAVLADLHVGSPHNGIGRLESIVRLTAEARPDLILLAGDFVIHGVVGGTFTPPEDFAPALRPLTAPLGVWAVLGNHDYWFDAARVRSALESVSIPVLEDAATPLRLDFCSFWLVGIGDAAGGNHDVKKALSGVPDGSPIVALTHNPDLFRRKIPARVNLTIAGHTHGGQVYLPLIGRPIVPSEYGERYAIGHVVEDGRHLFVSTGLGTSIIPVRFLVPPEVSVLILSAGGVTVSDPFATAAASPPRPRLPDRPPDRPPARR